MAKKSRPYKPTGPSWIDRLETHGKQVTTKKRQARIAAKPRLEVHEFFITVRGATENDPGQVDVGFFVIDDGFVILTNQGGEPVKDVAPHALGSADPKYVAALLLRKRRVEAGDSFNRPITYFESGWC